MTFKTISALSLITDFDFRLSRFLYVKIVCLFKTLDGIWVNKNVLLSKVEQKPKTNCEVLYSNFVFETENEREKRMDEEKRKI
jgi:hypothetical protein